MLTSTILWGGYGNVILFLFSSFFFFLSYFSMEKYPQ